MADQPKVPVSDSRAHLRSMNYMAPGLIQFISWRSIIAGLFVTFLTFATLTALGIGIGGLTLGSLVRDGTNFSIGAGIWFVVTALLSLFAGSYFAGRVSNYITTRVGAAQGLVIASVFFVFVLYQTGNVVGSAGSALGSAAGSMGGGVANVVNNPQVQQVVEQAVGDLNLRSAPDEVARGVAVRMLRGDTVSARNYLAREAGMTPAEAQGRIDRLTQNFQQTAQRAADTASSVVSSIGWSMFVTFLLGTIASILGGGLGSIENHRHPLGKDEIDSLRAGREVSA